MAHNCSHGSFLIPNTRMLVKLSGWSCLSCSVTHSNNQPTHTTDAVCCSDVRYSQSPRFTRTNGNKWKRDTNNSTKNTAFEKKDKTQGAVSGPKPPILRGLE
eukprot:GHVU01139274.1.p1 GENE.GHVU01139274.1~~GHVU01139274.1.p1  ORF type:complete len:102 (-),score=3.16 GHVU01139274.1:101-406(-)